VAEEVAVDLVADVALELAKESVLYGRYRV
jgi:hypothetical protein